MELYELPEQGVPPWDRASHSYAAWIPTITGHLSFSLIGSSGQNRGCRAWTQPGPDACSRTVIVQQRRAAQDYPLPGELVRVIRPQAAQDFLLIGRTCAARTPSFSREGVADVPDQQGALAGIVVVMPAETDPVLRVFRRWAMVALLDLIEASDVAADAVLARAHELLVRARQDGVTLAVMQVAVFRTGEFRLWFEQEKFLGGYLDQSLGGEFSDQDEVLALSLPSQAYFFVKDVTHNHYHHDPHSDQILPLTRLDAVYAREAQQENELKWRRETLWGLARVTTQFRRQNDLYQLRKALGVLAYAEAFQATLAGVLRGVRLSDDTVRHNRLAGYDFAHARASVEALEAAAAWRKSGWVQLVIMLVGTLISGLALWAAAVQIRPIMCPVASSQLPNSAEATCKPFPKTFWVDAVVAVTEWPFVFISALFVLGFAAFALVLRDATFVPATRRIVRFFSRAVTAIGSTVARRFEPIDGRHADAAGYTTALLTYTAVLAVIVRSVARLLSGLL